MKKKIWLAGFLLCFILLLTGAVSFSASAAEEHTCTGKIKIEIMTEGNAVFARCRRCREYIYPQQVSVDMEDGAVFCKGNCEIGVKDTGWSELTNNGYVLLYEGSGDTVYPISTLAPTEAGTYTVFLSLLTYWEIGEDAVRTNMTTPLHFTISTHEWTYSADARSLYATCQNCKKVAKVTLDASAVYEASRSSDCEQACQALFYEEDWNGQEGIASYNLLYAGVGVDEDGNESPITRCLFRPEYPGNYTACLVILDNFPYLTYTVGTEEMPFYVTGISMVQCEVADYTESEIAAFTKPRADGNTYYVGTASELLWCVYNQTTDMNLVLTNDIVVNPIAVTDQNTVSSGATVIHKWQGFGYQNARFSGRIDGNGHTIYGLYMPEARPDDWVSGFVCWGKNAKIQNLTIENSYFSATNGTGAFFGELLTDGETDAGLTNCKSLHNVVVSNAEAGGFIGWLNGSRETVKNSFVTIEKCINDSYVSGTIAAGGIVGKTAPSESEMICGGKIDACHNYGTVVGQKVAGGICGSLTPWNSIGFSITNCLNTGYVKGTVYESGILGEVFTHGQRGDLLPGCINISGNINVGELDFEGETVADILAKTGDTDYCTDGLINLENNYFSSEENPYPTTLADAPEGVSLSRSQVKAGIVCELLGGHTASSRYENVTMPACLSGGSKDLCCSVCGTVLETVEMTPHGHCKYFGVCVYCGESDNAENRLNASIFSPASWVVISAVSVGILSVGIVAVVRKNKKKKAVVQNEKE